MHNIKQKLYDNLHKLRLDNGLYVASVSDVYKKVWVRDTVYCSLPELKNNPQAYKQTYQTLLDYYISIENTYNKLSSLINEPHPKYGWRYPHPRFNSDLTEINELWGYKQWDAIFAFLFGICLGEENNIKIIRNDKDKEIIKMILQLADSLEYWNDPESGAWENEEDIRASSIGIVVSALRKLNNIGFEVPVHLIHNGVNALTALLPNETVSRKVDLIQLSLIYPFDIVTCEQRDIIINNIENELVREYGTIRHHNDWYYSSASWYNNHLGNEAQWTIGDLFLSIIHTRHNNIYKGLYYLNKVLDRCPNGEIPELYVDGVPNVNTPLGWALSLSILAIEEFEKYGRL